MQNQTPQGAFMAGNVPVSDRDQDSSKWTVLVAVMLGVIMGPIDGSIVNVVLPSIAVHFKVDYALAQWIPTIYLLSVCSFILFYGRLGDIFGYRIIYLTGLTCFIIASVLCGISQNIWMLIGFRALQGLMVAMQTALGLAIVTSTFPPHERGKAIGIYATSIAIGLMIGPILGGVIAQYLSWRYIFFINLPIGILALTLGLRVIPRGQKKPGQQIDLLGAILAFILLLSILLYANRAETWGWFSPSGIGLLACFATFSGLFFWVEKKSSHPMLNFSMFKNRRFTFACISVLLNFMAIFAVIFLTPWYLADALHYPVFKVGMVMMAFAFLSFFMGPINGSLSDRIGSRGLGFAGMTIHAMGLIMLSRLDAQADSLDVAWRLVICGLGVGIFQSPMNSAAMGSAPPQYRGVASSILAMMRSVGMAFGISLAGAIVYNLAPFTTRGHSGQFSGNQLTEFMNGLHWAFVTAAGLSLVSAIAALFAKAEKQTGPQD
jgi:EmrB/QacA subfamily drug resistance transporter